MDFLWILMDLAGPFLIFPDVQLPSLLGSSCAQQETKSQGFSADPDGAASCLEGCEKTGSNESTNNINNLILKNHAG